MPTIETFTGKESWENHSATFSVFHVDTGSLQQQPLYSFVKTALPSPEISQISRTAIAARPGMRVELGQWHRANYLLPPRSILKLYGQRHAGQGHMDAKAMMFIRLREEACHRHVVMPLSRGTVGAQSAAFVNGRFDVMTLDEAEACGINVAAHFRRFYEPAAVRLFTDNIVSPEVEARPVVRRVRVRNEHGQDVTFVRTKKPRALRLD